jgi:serine/threonine protein phosphatase PrpC
MKGKKDQRDLTLGQDNLSVSRLANGWQCICVTDGHGPDGHWVATRAARTIPFFLMQAECDALLRDGRVEEALRRAFGRAEEDLEFHGHEEQVRLFMSGCAATCVLRSPGARRAWAAFAGDSRAALLAEGSAPLRETRDHHPKVESELARCVEMGCELGVEEHDDGYVERRIFVKGKGYPGLLMTRSLGDLSVKRHGVVSTPEVLEWPAPQGALLIVASDGVWEVMSTQEASEIIFEALEGGKSRQEAVETLVSVARARWAEEDEDYCDDITVVLAPVDEELPALGSRSMVCCCGEGLSRGPCTLQ